MDIEFKSMAGLDRTTVLGQCKKGEYYVGIVDHNQSVIMFSKYEAIMHTPHHLEEP